MPTNERLEVAVADVERHELYWQALSSRVAAVEQRVAATEALLSNVLTTLQAVQSTLTADRQSVFEKAFAAAPTPVRVP